MQREANAASKDEESRNANTSLHYAAEKGWTAIAKKLMEHQAMPAAENQDGKIPLELAILNDHNECAAFLVKSMVPLR